MTDSDQQYFTPAPFGEAELVEKRSRFIARVWPVQTEEEALGYIELMRKQHRDANHNVYAYIIRKSGAIRYSDDGEPQGTSGQPTLGVFQREGLTDVCCVVTRYFGGTLLGAGGLVRAYSKAAKTALDAAGINQMRLWSMVLIPCPYALFEKIKTQIAQFEGIIESTEFGADILIQILVAEEQVSGFIKAVTDLSAATVEPVVMETIFRGVKVR